MKLTLYFGVVLSGLQCAVGEPVLGGKKTGHVAGYGQDNQKNIVGREKYPYAVFLEIHDKLRTDNRFYFCGGTIIRGRVVLTAAHCFTETSGLVDVYVVAGVLDRKIEKKRAQVRKMYDYHVHEDYDRFEVKKDKFGVERIKQYRHDIALIWVTEHFTYNAKVNQIPLMPPNSILHSKAGFILGWGQTKKGECSTILRRADLRVVSKLECESHENDKLYILDPGMLCTISDNKKSQQCSGDSGGPFVIDNKLAGVISNSFKDDVTLPNGKTVEMTMTEFGAIVTNVEYYTKWINDNVNKGPPRDRKYQTTWV